MQQAERLFKHREDSRTCLYVAGIDLVLLQLDVPIAKLVPEKVVKQLDRLVKLIRLERAIYREQAPKDKPAQMIEKIVEGKMGKFYGESCLLEQPFVKNPEQTITALVAERAKALGDTLEIRRFARFQVGEEIAS